MKRSLATLPEIDEQQYPCLSLCCCRSVSNPKRNPKSSSVAVAQQKCVTHCDGGTTILNHSDCHPKVTITSWLLPSPTLLSPFVIWILCACVCVFCFLLLSQREREREREREILKQIFKKNYLLICCHVHNMW